MSNGFLDIEVTFAIPSHFKQILRMRLPIIPFVRIIIPFL